MFIKSIGQKLFLINKAGRMTDHKQLNCILLVDDDSINNYLNERLIKKMGLASKIRTAVNGAEALEYIKKYCQVSNKCCPELIFLDINMPVMNGIEFLEVYRKLSFHNKERVRVIVLTTSSNIHDLKKIEEYGIKKYVSKPLTEQKVNELIAD